MHWCIYERENTRFPNLQSRTFPKPLGALQTKGVRCTERVLRPGLLDLLYATLRPRYGIGSGKKKPTKNINQ